MLDVINVGILGPSLAKGFIYPFYNAMKMVGVGVVFERLDPIAILIFLEILDYIKEKESELSDEEENTHEKDETKNT